MISKGGRAWRCVLHVSASATKLIAVFLYAFDVNDRHNRKDFW